MIVILGVWWVFGYFIGLWFFVEFKIYIWFDVFNIILWGSDMISVCDGDISFVLSVSYCKEKNLSDSILRLKKLSKMDYSCFLLILLLRCSCVVLVL